MDRKNRRASDQIWNSLYSLTTLFEKTNTVSLKHETAPYINPQRLQFLFNPPLLLILCTGSANASITRSSALKIFRKNIKGDF